MSPSIPMPLRAAAGLAAAAIDEARRLPDRLVGLPVLTVSTALQVSLKVQQRYAELVARGDALLEQLRGQQQSAPEWARFDDEEAFGSGDARPSAFDVVEVPVRGPAQAADTGRPGEVGAGEVWPGEAALSDLATDLVPNSVGDEDAEMSELAEAEQAADRLGAPAAGDAPADRLDAPADRLGAPAAGDAPADPRPEEQIDAVAADPAPDDGYLSAEPPLPNYDQLTLAQLRGKLRTLSEAQLAELVGYERGTSHRPPFLTMLENRLATLRGH
jgi:hypothetical protein